MPPPLSPELDLQIESCGVLVCSLIRFFGDPHVRPRYGRGAGVRWVLEIEGANADPGQQAGAGLTGVLREQQHATVELHHRLMCDGLAERISKRQRAFVAGGERW